MFNQKVEQFNSIVKRHDNRLKDGYNKIIMFVYGNNNYSEGTNNILKAIFSVFYFIFTIRLNGFRALQSFYFWRNGFSARNRAMFSIIFFVFGDKKNVYKSIKKPNNVLNMIDRDLIQVSLLKGFYFFSNTSLKISFLRNNIIYLKARFSKARAFCKTIVLFSLLLNIIVINELHSIYYSISINYGYLFQLMYLISFSFSVAYFLKKNKKR